MPFTSKHFILVISLCLLLVLGAASSSLRGENENPNNRRALTDNKDAKYQHWLQTKDLPFFEKVQEAAGRNTEYSRREAQKEQRLEAWKEHKGRYADDDYTAKESLRKETIGKTHMTYVRRKTRYEQRLADWQKEKLLDEEASTGGTKKLEDVTQDEVVTLFATLSIDSCEDYLKNANVDGNVLASLEDWRDVEKKVVPGAFIADSGAKELYTKVLEFKSKGVPVAFLDNKPNLSQMTAIQVYCKNPESAEKAANEPVDSAVHEGESSVDENVTPALQSFIQPGEEVPFVQPVDPYTGKKRSDEDIEGILDPNTVKKPSKTWFQWFFGVGK